MKSFFVFEKNEEKVANNISLQPYSNFFCYLIKDNLL